MRVVADTSRCVGAGQCVLTDPTIFDQSEDDGTVLILREQPPDEQAAARIREAVHICPSRALSLME